MSLPKEFKQEAEGRFLKAVSFSEPGRTLKWGGVKRVRAPANFRGADEEGMVWVYRFLDGEYEKEYSTNSKGFQRAIAQADPKPGDELHIVRKGEGFDSRYFVKIVGKGTTPEKKVEDTEISLEDMFPEN